jgi:hypothetical protein
VSQKVLINATFFCSLIVFVGKVSILFKTVNPLLFGFLSDGGDF